MRVLHVLAQRPGRTGSGTTLDALVREADLLGHEQAVLVGTPADDAQPGVGGLPPERVTSLRFAPSAAQADAAARLVSDLAFPVAGMSDVMPYPSSVWSTLSQTEIDAYRAAWERKLRTVCEGFDPELVHVHHAWLLAATIKDVAPRLPVVMHGHGTGLVQLAKCPGLAPVVHAGVARNERLCVLHEEHAERYARELAFEPARIRVVGAGYREEIFHARGRCSESGLVLYAGKLSRAKGLPWLLEAWPRVRERHPEARLELAGGGAGDEADLLRRRIEATDGCRALGELTPEALADRMRSAELFVLPSLAEGLPLVLVEAAACGARLVATDLPGTRALAEGLGERLFRVGGAPSLRDAEAADELRVPGFVEAWAEALTKALAPNRDRASRLELEQLSWGAVARRVESVWREVLVPS